ncbi:hypothetical protein AEP_01715 [Curvibacter sp. AEP1-3]|uniref:hypothetical protein n=1 Tax=Curvibacter sp. AEP1-3 TaxID=1844971 RepID=UPI000B57085F|nr:hypothetical protein [Curvibacter sp. AEP1-3]ARV18659.1 hypothetical protein AEP_01715 [Curvibacter sp. AEP1-3]
MNIIIVSDVPPDARYTAGQVLYRAIDGLCEHQFRFYWFNQSRLDMSVTLPANCHTVAVLDTQYGRTLAFLMSVCNFLMRHLIFMARPIYGAKAALALGSLMFTAVKLGLLVRRDPARLVWFVLQGERTTMAYRIVTWIASKPYMLQQWDPLTWWMGHRQHPRKLISVAKGVLHRLEQTALVNIVPSDVWKKKLQQEGKTATRLDNFFRQSLLDETRFVALCDPRALHTVFVGQFYAGAELLRIVQTLQLCLQGSGRRLVIHLFGSSSGVRFEGCEVIEHGYLGRDALIQRIAKWDLALLPYPMAPGHKETALLSFPSKARIYLAAGLPVLAHAPTFSAVHQFMAQHYPTHYCNIEVQNRPAQFVDSLLNASYADRYKRFEEARCLISAEFSEAAELQPLRAIIGVEV